MDTTKGQSTPLLAQHVRRLQAVVDAFEAEGPPERAERMALTAIRALWARMRIDPFPTDMRHLLDHLSGSRDLAEVARRLLTFGPPRVLH